MFHHNYYYGDFQMQLCGDSLINFIYSINWPVSSVDITLSLLSYSAERFSLSNSELLLQVQCVLAKQ